jgi:hypothetical protein
VGTFHHDKGELHGITVVVDTAGPRVYVGRCDVVAPEGVVLLGADVHEEGPGRPSKAEFLAKAARVGVWARHDRIVVPTADVSRVTPLGALRP